MDVSTDIQPTFSFDLSWFDKKKSDFCFFLDYASPIFNGERSNVFFFFVFLFLFFFVVCFLVL